MATETVFECPQCKKNGMVRLHSEGDIFECIYCHYTSDLSSDKKQSEQGLSWFALLTLVLITLLIVTGL